MLRHLTIIAINLILPLFALGQSPVLKLNNGAAMPQLGLGTLQIGEGRTSYIAMCSAISDGYRHIDIGCPDMVTDVNIGQAIDQCGLKREDVWITASLWIDDHNRHSASHAVDSLLNKLNLNYFDMLYLRQPKEDGIAHWHEMENILSDGKTRAIGISDFDFDSDFYNSLIEKCNIKPDAIQVVCAPYSPLFEWYPILKKDNIVLECLYPIELDMCEKEILTNPVLSNIASAHNKTPMQVMMRWHLQQGISVVPSTDDPDTISSLIDIFDFELSEEEIETVKMLGENTHPTPEILKQVKKLIEGYEVYSE